MRAYSVLADILEARGDKKGAEENRAAVTAIRLSEKADRFYEAGLLTRAVQMYNEALGHFENAYCIQSRLALRETELGHHDAAEAHYRKAYELMPDSFGRVESHCFGCERAFSGRRAESIADKAFLQLVKSRPEKPQVHYLLGYLREEEGRYREALPEFQEAVKLDPEYLNAWKSIDGLGKRMGLPAAQRDAVTINVVRLDPLGRHSSPNFAEATDLAAIWKAVEAAEAEQAPVPQTLLALPASKAALEKSAAASRESDSRYVPEAERNGRTPAEAVADNQFVALAGQLFGLGSVLNLQ
ncbi:MAG: tetratricopeptide repeat protein [Chthoniobacterales bacterium]